MKKITFLFAMLVFIGINLSMKAQTYVPLTISSGFNQDVIANGSGAAASSTSVVYDDNTSYGVYFAEDYNPSGSGHPCGGIPSAAFTSLNSGAVYRLVNVITSGNNCLFLVNQFDNGTLVFTNPGSFDHISICASSSVTTLGSATLQAQLNFSDGSNTIYSFDVPDWFNTSASNYCIWNLGRTFRAGPFMNGFDGCNGTNGPNNSRMFDCIITLSGADKVKVLNSINCSKTDVSTQKCGIFAVCGVTPVNAPPAVVATAATSGTSTSFSANWNATVSTPYAVTGYYLDVSTTSDFSGILPAYNNLYIAGQSTTTWPVTGLSPVTTYYYRLRAVNSAGVGPNSNIITVLPVPPAVVATAATSISQTSFSSNWNVASTATAYYLDVSTSNSFSSMLPGYNNLSVGNVLTYPVTGLSIYSTYYYRLRAGNSSGIGPVSNVITVTTLIPTLSEWGLIILGFLFLSIGTIVILRGWGTSA